MVTGYRPSCSGMCMAIPTHQVQSFIKKQNRASDSPAKIIKSPVLPKANKGKTPILFPAENAKIENGILENQKKQLNEKLYDRLARATVWIQPRSNQFRQSGFVFDRENCLILTTASGLDELNTIEVQFPSWDRDRLIAEIDFYQDRLGMYQHGTRQKGVVLCRDKGRDLAIIQVKSLPNSVHSLPAFPIVKATVKSAENQRGKEVKTPSTKEPPIEIGTNVYAVQQPMGVDILWSFTKGVIRQKTKIPISKNRTNQHSPTSFSGYLLQIPHQTGSSGAALVDDRFQVIGMILSKSSLEQQLGFAITWSEISSFIQENHQLVYPQSDQDFELYFQLLVENHALDLAEKRWSVKKLPINDLKTLQLMLQWASIDKNISKIQAILRNSEKILSEADLLYWKIHLDNMQGKYRSAQEKLAVFEKSFPNYPQIWLEKGVTHRLSGEFLLAKKILVQGLEHDPVDNVRIEALWHLGLIAESQKEVAEAQNRFAEILRLYPKHLEARIHRLELFRVQKKWREALLDAEELIEQSPLCQDNYRLAGELALRWGDLKKAKQFWIDTLRIQNSNAAEIWKKLQIQLHEQISEYPTMKKELLIWVEELFLAWSNILSEPCKIPLSTLLNNINHLQTTDEKWDSIMKLTFPKS